MGTVQIMKVVDVNDAPKEVRKEIGGWLGDLNRTAVRTTVGEIGGSIEEWLTSIGCEPEEEVLLNFDW